MLTTSPTHSGAPTGAAPQDGGSPRRRRPRAALLKAVACVALTALIQPVARPDASPAPAKSMHTDGVEQYEAGGTRWLDSRHQELVHFVCHPGMPYVISLNSVSLLSAGVLLEDQGAYLEALREAARDWSGRMRCPWIQVEMDHPDPDTRVLFAYIDRPGTLAVATRAGDITLNAGRAWFPGSKRQGNYTSQRHQVSFYWVAAHELGHVWGIAHSDNPLSLMHPTQCATCRWSSFEQAAANVMYAASVEGDWSRPYYTSRFFVRTPVAAIEPLLTGDLPDDVLIEESASCELGMCVSQERGPDARPLPPECEPPEVLPTSSLVGLPELVRLSRHLRERILSHIKPVSLPRRRPPQPAPPLQRPDRNAILGAPVAILTRTRHPEAPWYIYLA